MQLTSVALRQGGVFTRAQARACGWSDDAIDRRLWCGEWVRSLPSGRGVFQHASIGRTYESIRWAAVLGVGPPCALGLESAAAEWGWCSEPGIVTLVVGLNRKPRSVAPVAVKRLALADGDVVRLRGLPVTSKARTVADCLRFLPQQTAQQILDRSQQRGGPAPAAVLLQLPRGGSGVRQARRLLRAADGSVFAAERLCVALLRRGGIEGWRANVAVDLCGRRIVLDVAFVAARLALEIDGWAHHHDVDRFQADRRRQNLLVGSGWRVLRFTYADLTTRPDDVLRQVREALAAT
jgi:very-short-patch-repair endonuclease